MKALAAALLLCCCVASSAQAAIECLSSPDPSASAWWSWREIDGRKCWYKKTGAVPPKSEFVWPEPAKDAPPAADAPQAAAAAPATEGTAAAHVESTPPLIASTQPRIEMVPVKPVELTDPNFRLGDGRVGLLEGYNLAGARGIGGAWEVPRHVGPFDTFDARYGHW